MKKNVKNAIIGGVIGTAAGCAVAGIRTAAAFCPLAWIVSDAAILGLLGYRATNEHPAGAAVGTVAGAGLDLG